MSAPPTPIKSEHSSEWHWEKFAEFTRFKAEVGEPSPHMTVVGHLSRECSTEEKIWRAGCYATPYSLLTAEVLWTEWPLARIQSSPDSFLPWVHEHWRALHTRTERRCVRTPEKFARCLLGYARWMPELKKLWANIAAENMPAQLAYDLLWDSASSVDFFGRYITIRLLELLKRYADLPAQLYDIRSIGGWSPIRALCLFFPKHTADLLGKESTRWADELANAMLTNLDSVEIDHYVLAAMLCEYREAYEDCHQYPGRTQDQEIEYYNRFAPYWLDRGFKFKLLEARAELFPAECLGELSGWSGIRHELSRTLRDHGYNWSDKRYDFGLTGSRGSFAQPIIRGGSPLTKDTTPALIDKEHAGLHFRLLPCDEVVYNDNIVRQQHLRHISIERDEVWLDVGGYIGTFALLAAQRGAKVVSFEPDPDSRERLKTNILLNGMTEQIRVSPRAVLAEAGEVSLYLNNDAANPAANSTINRWKRPHPTLQIQAISMKDAIEMTRRAQGDGPLGLKIDIEGAEIPILESFDFSVFEKLIVEYHFHADARITRLRQILARLEQQGFHYKLEHKLPDKEEWPNPRKRFMTFWATREVAGSLNGSKPAEISVIESTIAEESTRSRGAITQVFPGLYQRGHFLTWPLERKKTALTSLNIDVVVNLWNKVDPDLSSILKGLIYLNWPLDGDTVPPELEEMTTMISALLAKGRNVLVHCEAGKNRSIFFCAVLIAHIRGCSGVEALELIMTVQPRAKLNRNLRRYLELELT